LIRFFAMMMLTRAMPTVASSSCTPKVIRSALVFAAMLATLSVSEVAAQSTVKLGYLYKMSGPTADAQSDNWLVESFNQFKLAIKDVNADASILPATTLDYEMYNGMGDPAATLAGALDLKGKDVVGVVGTGFSTAIPFAAAYLSLFNVPMISPGSTLLDYSDKTNYPYLMRSIASDASQLKGFVALAHSLQFKKAAFVSSKDWYAGSAPLINAYAEAVSLSVNTYQYASSDEATDILTKEKSAGTALFLLYAKTEDMDAMALAAASSGTMTSDFAWFGSMSTQQPLISDWPNFFFLSQRSLETNTAADAYMASWTTKTTLWNASTHGWFDPQTMKPFFIKDETVYDTANAATGDGKPDVWGQYVYDTVWLYAYAIHALQTDGGSVEDKAALRKQLLATDFVGITGRVFFDQATQDRAADYDLMLGESKVVELVSSGLTQAVSESWCATSCVAYADGTPWNMNKFPWVAGRPEGTGEETGGLTCGTVKDFYKMSKCCGNPSMVISPPEWR